MGTCEPAFGHVRRRRRLGRARVLRWARAGALDVDGCTATTTLFVAPAFIVHQLPTHREQGRRPCGGHCVSELATSARGTHAVIATHRDLGSVLLFQCERKQADES